MKILYTNFHGAAGIGGHTSYILRLARALAPQHEIVVAAPPGSALDRLAREIPGVRFVPQRFPNAPGRAVGALAPLRALLRREAFDVAHVNGSADHRLVILACLGMGGRRPAIVFTKHNDLPIGALGAAVRARAGTDRVIGVCDFVTRALQQTAYRRCGIATIANGIDIAHFAPEQGDAALAQAWRSQWLGARPQGKLLLGSNAGTDDYKGWIDLVRGLAQLPASLRERVHIALAGSEPAQPLREEVGRLGLQAQVHYAGRLDDVRPFIAALDAGFVLSFRVETISFACREMMAMGKPVLVSRHAGLPENIDPGRDGWIVPVRDAQALAAWLRQALQGDFDLAAMGRAARAKAERDFGLAPFVSRTLRVYQDASAARPA
ncbi:glycosyltransferase [Orrella sp. JC864]|uniref:glycosyltransferase n=1 Tax=Orrella sp. JC864 TaxID=3120298 RepID=UPI00300982CC